jgi:hypothetical protein
LVVLVALHALAATSVMLDGVFDVKNAVTPLLLE